MRGEKESIESLGGRLAFVGSGSTRQAAGFHERYVAGCAVFTDPSAYTYRAVGARSGVVSTLSGTFRHGLRAMRGGHFQTTVEGRPFQHGGVLVALPGDVAAYAYISREAGAHPDGAEVVEALRLAVGAPAPADATHRRTSPPAAGSWLAAPTWPGPPRDPRLPQT